MKRYEILKKVGSMQQIAAVRPITYEEGQAKGLKAFDIKNGNLRLQVLADKCLDIAELSYKGVNLSFLAKPGITGNLDCEMFGGDSLRNQMAGFLFTCGLDNTCGACEVDGKTYPTHGRIRNIPAEHVSADASWEDDSYVMKVSGKMRDASLLGNNMTLKRSIETVYGEKTIKITDIIENVSYKEQPMMILYHFNMGYPLLDEFAQVLLPTKEVTPVDEKAKAGLAKWDVMEAPSEAEDAKVFLHDLIADEAGNTRVCLVNEVLELGISISFNKKYLPRFMQWKTIGAGDYTMGLEPTNGGIRGRAGEGENIHKIAPFEKEIIEIKVTILDGKEELAKEKVIIEELKKE